MTPVRASAIRSALLSRRTSRGSCARSPSEARARTHWRRVSLRRTARFPSTLKIGICPHAESRKEATFILRRCARSGTGHEWHRRLDVILSIAQHTRRGHDTCWWLMIFTWMPGGASTPTSSHSLFCTVRCMRCSTVVEPDVAW